MKLLSLIRACMKRSCIERDKLIFLYNCADCTFLKDLSSRFFEISLKKCFQLFKPLSVKHPLLKGICFICRTTL